MFKNYKLFSLLMVVGSALCTAGAFGLNLSPPSTEALSSDQELVKLPSGDYQVKFKVTTQQKKERVDFKAKLKAADPENRKVLLEQLKTDKELRKKLGYRETPLTADEKQARKEFSEKYQAADDAGKKQMRDSLKTDTALKQRLGLN
jgi:hypothetical protein